MVHEYPKGLCSFYSDIYEVVDDPSLDSIISWSKSNKGFVIWNPQELIEKRIVSRFFCRELSQFISDVELFGFRRVKGSKHMKFTNANFVRGQPDLLKKMQSETSFARFKKRRRAARAKAQVEERLQRLQI
ncbi:heat stress transcription factor A-4a [Raphanus sativus]|uniref:Heat stress transcription factor A-4a n=1 Tax=Raphanus sativus TaxID=3726 RepID=A0A6J0MCQ0_RAPSA|nr:heat stress transcription factor A-4a [Raphanus sativus]